MLEPVCDYVVVELEAEERQTPVGVLLPEAMDERNKPRAQWGRVVAVGPGRMSRKGVQIPPQVERGDRVCFDRFAGTEMVVEHSDGRDRCVLIREGELLARGEPLL